MRIMFAVIDWWREVTLPRSHKRRIKSARRVLAKIRPWEPARVFGYLRKIDPLAFEELTLEAGGVGARWPPYQKRTPL